MALHNARGSYFLRAFFRSVSLASLLVLAACADNPFARTTASPQTGDSPKVFSNPAVAALPSTTPPGARPSGPSAPPMIQPKIDPQTLIGKKAEDIAALLGEPALKRRDPPAHYWQYRSESCLLDLYLYDGSEGTALTRIDARPRTPEHSISAAQCLDAVLSLKHAKAAG